MEPLKPLYSPQDCKRSPKSLASEIDVPKAKVMNGKV